MHALNRLRSVCQSRGAWGFVRFVGSRLYARRRDLLFEAETADGGSEPSTAEIGKLLCIERENLTAVLTPQMKHQIFTGEGAEYLAGLRHEDLLFALVDAEGNCLHHSFVLFDTRTKILLNESVDIPLFAHCITRLDARGKHVYPRVLRHGLAALAKRGHTRAIVNCDPDNEASIASIRRAGFRLARTLETRIFLSCIGWQETRRCDGKTERRFFVG